MSKPKLTYFDAPVSRGEECRLALHAAGVDFEDNRLSREAWLALKPNTPFGNVPFLEIPGKPALGHSTAIMTFIGRMHDLHPKDPFEAARHEAMMGHIEDARNKLGATMRIADAAEKKAAREDLAQTYLPAWATHTEAQFGEGPFFGGAALNVVDFKILLLVRWIRSGALDHLPKNVFEAFPKLNAAHDAVAAHPSVVDWYTKHPRA
jgi:prostaglandin-H2 D-isomerase / glutathione transferase